MQEAVATAAIEGEQLDLETVRSSVARRLGVAGAMAQRAPRHIDGLLDLMDDTVGKAAKPRTGGCRPGRPRCLPPATRAWRRSALVPIATMPS